MVLKKLHYIDLPEHVKPEGFDHAAVHTRLERLYIAHTLGFNPAQNKIYAFLPQTYRAVVYVDVD